MLRDELPAMKSSHPTSLILRRQSSWFLEHIISTSRSYMTFATSRFLIGLGLYHDDFSSNYFALIYMARRQLLYTTWSFWCLDHRMKTTVREEKDRSAAGLPVLVSGTTYLALLIPGTTGLWVKKFPKI
eukprot:SAG11_NODE_7_length_31267_cov_19.541966_8_plen_129_part_00